MRGSERGFVVFFCRVRLEGGGCSTSSVGGAPPPPRAKNNKTKQQQSITGREVCVYSISCKNQTNIDLTLQWLTKHAKT